MSGTFHFLEQGPEHILEHKRIATAPRRIGAECIDKLNLNVQHLTEMDELLVSLETYLLSEKLAEDSRTFHYSWPASAWQRWKLTHPRVGRYLPAVRYIKAQASVEVASWATYPEATLITPDLGRPVIMQEVHTAARIDDIRGSAR